MLVAKYLDEDPDKELSSARHRSWEENRVQALEEPENQEHIQLRTQVNNENSDININQCSHADPSVQGQDTNPRLTKSEKRDQKRQARVAKSLSKTRKNQDKITIAVREEDIERVAKIIHGNSYRSPRDDAHPLATDATIEEVIERNIGFCSSIASHNKALLESMAQTRKRRISEKDKRMSSQRAESAVDIEDVVTAILAQLDIITPMAPASTSKTPQTPRHLIGSPKARNALFRKLRDTVREDIEKYENEQRETASRCAGFWRYCGKAIFDRMSENAKEIDWRTGENLRKGAKGNGNAFNAEEEDLVNEGEDDVEQLQVELQRL